MSKGVRNYCFTLFDYTDRDILQFSKCTLEGKEAKTPGEPYNKGDTKPFISYYIFGKERCPKTDKPHLQGYLEMPNQKTITALKKCLGMEKLHLEEAKGSAKDNVKYCSKDDNVTTEGTPKSQGKRVDLDAIKNEIVNGKKVDDICLENPEIYHQYARTLTKIEDITMRKRFRTEMTTCDWYCGPTGVGKSHLAFKDFNPATHYLWKNDDNGWQDGYCGQEIVIINEFRGNIAYGRLLELIDKWPTEVKRRGKEPMPFLAKKIIITSSLAPYEVYHNLEQNDSLDQLKRRVNVYFKLKQEDEWEPRWKFE